MILLVVSLFNKLGAAERGCEAEPIKFLGVVGVNLWNLSDHTNSVDEESNTLIETCSMRNEWCG